MLPACGKYFLCSLMSTTELKDLQDLKDFAIFQFTE